MITRRMRKELFVVLTRDNAQHITLNDNEGRAAPESVVTLNSTEALWLAIASYARRNGIESWDVGYACRPVREGEI